MKLICLVALCLAPYPLFSQTAQPLRIFLRAGPKTHGPGQHDGPRWLAEWKPLLSSRGAKVDGAIGFPTAEQLENTDVLVMYSAEGGAIKPAQREYLDKFLKRGGGIVAIHDSVCGDDAQWFKTIIGGAWEHGHSKWFEGDVAIYYTDRSHPITKDVSNFDFDDEIYWDLHMMPEAHILAATYAPDRRNTKGGRIYPSVYDIVPQMWTYEKELAGATSPYRAFVSIPGHMHKSFGLPHFRAVLLRGIAWAGKRDVDSLCDATELASLRYPEGGPTAPEKAAEKIVVPPEFNIRLVASEPLINKAISLDWDPAGRMWVAETPEYPNGRRINPNDKVIAAWKDKDPATFVQGKEERPARDRISILEDPDPQGRYRKKAVFYEGLELVTSLVFYRDGVIVSQAPDILWLRDTDGDGKADKVEKLYTGFGTADTHAVISNLRWGMDGWVYATVGYSRGDIYSGDNQTHFGRISEGVIRFKPNGKALEQISSKGGNCWGVDFSWDNEIFWTQATSGDHLMHVALPESFLARGKIGSTTSYHVTEDHKKSYPLMSWPMQAYVQIDLVGSYTAVAGCCIYNGGAWPEKWNGSQFCSEPTINIVHHDFLKPTGSTYLATREKEEEFIGSRDLWFRPIHTRVGPDGALYIIDLYNQAVVHNDTRGTPHGANNAAVRPDRDHYFARIWRIQHNEAKKLEIPNLAKATPAELAKALEHPNMWARMTAERLLAERGDGSEGALGNSNEPVRQLARNHDAPPYARVQALWTRRLMAAAWAATRLPDPTPVFLTDDLEQATHDPSPAVRKAAFQIVSEDAGQILGDGTKLLNAASSGLRDSDPRARLWAILAAGAISGHSTAARSEQAKQVSVALVSIYPELHDPWLESAVVGVATQNPVDFIQASLAAADPQALQSLVRQLSNQVASKADATMSSALVVSVTSAPASADALKQVILEDLARGLKSDTVPAWMPELQKAFQALLASPNPGLGAAALPLIARWDKDGAMAGDLKSLVQQLMVKLNDAAFPDEQRAQVATSLLAVRQMNPDILPAIGRILGSSSSPALQRQVIEALGVVVDSSIGALLVDAYGKLNPSLQEAVFTQLIKRSDSSLALVEALKSGKIDLASLGPIAVGRLRTHSDKAVATRANAVLDELRGPEVKEKNALIAQFTPEVEKPGNIENGHKLFTQNCSVCHSFKGEGKDVAPDLTGMGAKGAEELLVHVLDPNRYVEPNFFSFSIETKDGETYDGIIGRENRSSVVLRNASGDVEVKVENIKSRRNTGLSLMPNGFEALGGEGLRDLLGYICADENRYRMLDLKDAFTTSSTRGIYVGADLLEDTLRFKKFGIVRGGNVPFEIITPNRTAAGNNLIVLKGGEGVAKSMPQKVEIDHVGVKASRLHFLGGVGGWAWPFGDKSRQNMPVVKVTVSFADAQTEEIILRNGVEFVDWIDANNDVPGSKQIPDLLRRGQVRWFTKTLQHRALIQKITLESFDNAVAPTFVAITAEVGEGAETATTPAIRNTQSERRNTEPVALNPEPTPSPLQWGPGIKTLIFGGGSSHDFGRWFNQADTVLLRMGGKASVNYTDKPSAVLPALKDIDVLYVSSNQPLPDPALHKAVFDFADAGKGLVLVHPGLWYNWKNWPEYNRQLVGGGASSHDKFGEFEVTVGETSHVIMTGVPATFKISDELYHVQRDEQGPPIQVLATGKSPITGKTFPVVWIVKHPKARIVCVTLGHDGKAHELPAFQAILQNSVAWAAGK